MKVYNIIYDTKTKLTIKSKIMQFKYSLIITKNGSDLSKDHDSKRVQKLSPTEFFTSSFNQNLENNLSLSDVELLMIDDIFSFNNDPENFPFLVIANLLITFPPSSFKELIIVSYGNFPGLNKFIKVEPSFHRLRYFANTFVEDKVSESIVNSHLLKKMRSSESTSSIFVICPFSSSVERMKKNFSDLLKRENFKEGKDISFRTFTVADLNKMNMDPFNFHSDKNLIVFTSYYDFVHSLSKSDKEKMIKIDYLILKGTNLFTQGKMQTYSESNLINLISCSFDKLEIFSSDMNYNRSKLNYIKIKTKLNAYETLNEYSEDIVLMVVAYLTMNNFTITMENIEKAFFTIFSLESEENSVVESFKGFIQTHISSLLTYSILIENQKVYHLKNKKLMINLLSSKNSLSKVERILTSINTSFNTKLTMIFFSLFNKEENSNIIKNAHKTFLKKIGHTNNSFKTIIEIITNRSLLEDSTKNKSYLKTQLSDFKRDILTLIEIFLDHYRERKMILDFETSFVSSVNEINSFIRFILLLKMSIIKFLNYLKNSVILYENSSNLTFSIEVKKKEVEIKETSEGSIGNVFFFFGMFKEGEHTYIKSSVFEKNNDNKIIFKIDLPDEVSNEKEMENICFEIIIFNFEEKKFLKPRIDLENSFVKKTRKEKSVKIIREEKTKLIDFQNKENSRNIKDFFEQFKFKKSKNS